MHFLKKSLTFTFLLALAVSPLIPFAGATDGQWNSAVSEATWDYDLYHIDRLALSKNISPPRKLNDGVFVSEPSKSCKYPAICETVDITLFKNGSTLRVSDVNPRVNSAFAHNGQDERFVFMVPSKTKTSWGTMYEYLPQSGTIQTVQLIERKDDDLNYIASTVDGSRVYSTILHADATTGAIETKLTVSDATTSFKRDDFTWSLNTPWQEILDVRNGIVLAKFRFDGGNKQLVLIDEAARKVKEIPGTWTSPEGDILAAHFLPDGTVQYFQNYRLYTYKPGDAKPMESGGANLNWFVAPELAVQVVGGRMAYIDSKNTLYVTGPQGASSFGTAIAGKFTLKDDAIYYQTSEGQIGYTFSTKTWKTRHYRVTDFDKDILIGVDSGDEIWVENVTSGKIVNIGFGTDPVLTDREHAIWKGKDGRVYQATFSTRLDLEDANVQAFKVNGTSTVYLQTGKKIWRVPDEATYFTWFDSWKSVKSVSSQVFKGYLATNTLMGNAPFAPGTRVKAAGNPRVYVTGSDGSLHWIISEAVANSIYGSIWNKGILEVRPERLWNYSTGIQVDSSKVILSI